MPYRQPGALRESKGEPEVPSEASCGDTAEETRESLTVPLELLHGIVRFPLGTDPDRDARIKAAWHSGP